MIQAVSPAPLHFEVAAKSDPGVLRTLNEDRVLVDPALGLLVLADGMGGHKAGEVASTLAVETIAKELTAARMRGRNAQAIESLLRKVISHASRRVFSESERRARKSGNHPDQTMGTTIAVLLMNGAGATIAHVGDSRVYRLRGNKLSLLTRDHSLLQEQIDSGTMSVDTALGSHNRHLVTRGLGHGESVDVAIAADQPQIDDIYLLCSDGLNDMLDDDEIELILNAVGANLPLAAEQLVMIANDAGGEDNISVALARVRAGAATEPKRRNFFDWLFRR
jgi:PPM family protein phosphatase